MPECQDEWLRSAVETGCRCNNIEVWEKILVLFKVLTFLHIFFVILHYFAKLLVFLSFFFNS